MRFQIVLILATIFAAAPCWAATVEKVDGLVLTLSLKGEALQRGVFYSVSKQKVHFLVLRANTKKAKVRLMKGKLKQGESFSISKTPVKYERIKRPQNKAGVLLGGNQSSSDITFGDGSKKNLTGNGIAVAAFFEHNISQLFSLAAFFGVEQLRTDGASAAACDGTCEIAIDYLFTQVQTRWNVEQSSQRYWAGLGVGYHYPISRTTTAVRYSSIEGSIVPMLSLGVAKSFTQQTEWSLQLYYLRFPSKAQAKTFMMGLQVGHAWKF